MSESAPIFSIVIVTRNRADDLRRALQTCFEQTSPRFEVLVYDDASTDHTPRVCQQEFKEVRYFRTDIQVGYIVLRNRGFRDARGEFIISIDDDAYFSSPDCLHQLAAKWAKHPAAGALAISYLEPTRSATETFMLAPQDGEQVRNYIGCAHSLRREVAERLGGYREYFVHQGEERDLCLRMLASGLEVRYVEISPIVHVPSPKRDQAQLAYLGVRNTFLFSFLNAPFPVVIYRIASDAFNLFRYKLTMSTLWRRGAIVFTSLMSCAYFFSRRSPVPPSTFYLFRSLPLHGPRRPSPGELNSEIIGPS